MAEEVILATRASIAIYVDKVVGETAKGEFEYMLREKYVRPFNDFGHMILELDCLMDTLGTPQAYMERRSWVPRRDKGRQRVKDTGRAGKKPLLRYGKKATFVLYVYFRKNATWQGELNWIEEKRFVMFCSTLELLHLLESAAAQVAYRQMGQVESYQAVSRS